MLQLRSTNYMSGAQWREIGDPMIFFYPLVWSLLLFLSLGSRYRKSQIAPFWVADGGECSKKFAASCKCQAMSAFLLYYTQQCIFISKRLCGSCLLAADGRWREFHATSWRETFTWEYMKNRIYSIGLKAISLSNSSSPVQIQTLLFGMAERAISPR